MNGRTQSYEQNRGLRPFEGVRTSAFLSSSAALSLSIPWGCPLHGQGLSSDPLCLFADEGSWGCLSLLNSHVLQQGQCQEHQG